MVRGKATPDAFSVCTNSGLAPGAGRKRMLARRAWKSSNVDALEASSQLPTPGAQTSRSKVHARREAGVARRERQHAVGNLEPLQHRLGVRGEQRVFARTLLGSHQPDQLDLVELVHADQAARVLAVRARLAAEARRVGRHRDRQIGRVEDLVAVDVGDRHFRVGIRKRSSALAW